MNGHFVYKQSNQLIFRKIDEESILVPVQDNIAKMDSVYALNEVGTFVWEHINGINNINQIAELITTVFNVGINESKQSVFSLIQDLEKNKLILKV